MKVTKLILVAMTSTIVGMSVWINVMISDVQDDVDAIGIQLDSMRVILSEMNRNSKTIDTDISGENY
jgi:hypothetical protein|tara:strand:+ start:701 stop:901 length:201 start_codon:yes stop_codon:yes gene_type:complete